MTENSCPPLTREMLGDPVDIELEGELDFDRAQELAWQKARELKIEPMLLSWYDREAGRWSPPVECCGEDRPAWLIYAQSRGADLAVAMPKAPAGKSNTRPCWTGIP